MSEAAMLELIRSVRDAARSNAMLRLAEHLDDAMLIAASEAHDRMMSASVERDVLSDPAPLRIAPQGRLN